MSAAAGELPVLLGVVEVSAFPSLQPRTESTRPVLRFVSHMDGAALPTDEGAVVDDVAHGCKALMMRCLSLRLRCVESNADCGAEELARDPHDRKKRNERSRGAIELEKGTE